MSTTQKFLKSCLHFVIMGYGVWIEERKKNYIKYKDIKRLSKMHCIVTNRLTAASESTAWRKSCTFQQVGDTLLTKRSLVVSEALNTHPLLMPIYSN